MYELRDCYCDHNYSAGAQKLIAGLNKRRKYYSVEELKKTFEIYTFFII